MTVYLLAEIEITDPVGIEKYLAEARPLTERMGGRYEMQGESIELLEGSFRSHRAAVITFESEADFRRWYDSEEYRPLKELRQRSANTRMIIINGFT